MQGLSKGMSVEADVAALAADVMESDVGALEEDGMDVDAEGRSEAPLERKGKHKYTEEFKEKILDILRVNGFEDKRSAKLAQDDFLQLLAVFNKQGIHFA